MKKTDKTGPAVQSLKLLAQATGEYTRDELNKDGRLSWTDKAEEMIAQAKAANGGGSNTNGGGTNTNNTNPTNGGGNGGNDDGMGQD
jgi:hypothetical protein